MIRTGQIAKALVLCALMGCGAARQQPGKPPEVTPETLYPLSEGNAWSYDVDTGSDRVLAITRVERVEGLRASVRSGGETLHYELRSDGIYRPARQGYLLRVPLEPGAQWDAGGGTTARVAEVGITVETPAGRFEQCVRVVERSPGGAHIETTYCPGVGPAVVRSQLALRHGTARVEARLRGYALSPPM